MDNKTNVAFRLSILLIMVVLGVNSDDCSSYYDSNGDYVYSFSCPQSNDGYSEIYCCGTSSYKYCCDYSTWLSFDYESDWAGDFDDAVGLGISIILGIVFGIIGLIVLIILCIVACVCCCAQAGQSSSKTTVVHAPNQVSPASPVVVSQSSAQAQQAVPQAYSNPPPNYAGQIPPPAVY
ncbi:uncharacterized protein LOC100374598 isoform X1 [Saccoglossus kowalevskii]|uniref:Membrane protein FAM159A-like isoform X1 n=1 Tax=Saccoglossus kowalevskii TaxID=10224 RepID=A0ABM0H003_SACKO|nr:PREDICTED: membrane protein FAM159A-like isoform X1 [Saccoglossus kowalevskii]XP_002741173.1 PREDICTED: membrane protein FAM159A-like isoform X2 [Saccoglossus kowalevskii]